MSWLQSNTCWQIQAAAFSNLLFGTLLKWYYAVLALLHVNIVTAAQRQARPLAVPARRLFFNALRSNDCPVGSDLSSPVTECTADSLINGQHGSVLEFGHQDPDACPWQQPRPQSPASQANSLDPVLPPAQEKQSATFAAPGSTSSLSKQSSAEWIWGAGLWCRRAGAVVLQSEPCAELQSLCRSASGRADLLLLLLLVQCLGKGNFCPRFPLRAPGENCTWSSNPRVEEDPNALLAGCSLQRALECSRRRCELSYGAASTLDPSAAKPASGAAFGHIALEGVARECGALLEDIAGGEQGDVTPGRGDTSGAAGCLSPGRGRQQHAESQARSLQLLCALSAFV
ncbi:hypothetical protein Anapl_11913 [Anas platyrhynchos]|uniref:Uncharacterized protein n=1 Tax=Anas platyrhynchos TaxID=8839 RepID=R0LFJ9_ANAPL|nr:hypothetical protein Anapl_11913 [Anas platyrhynchos]